MRSYEQGTPKWSNTTRTRFWCNKADKDDRAQQGGHPHIITLLPIILPIIYLILSHKKNTIIGFFCKT